MSCDICNGRPNCPCCSKEPETETCELCDGKGQILIDVNGDMPGEEYNPDDYTSVTCPYCDGDGVIYLKDYEQD